MFPTRTELYLQPTEPSSGLASPDERSAQGRSVSIQRACLFLSAKGNPETALPAHLLAPELSPSAWVAQHLGSAINLDPMQSQILDSPANRIALLCSRQWGKSTVIALKLLHYALHHPNTRVVIAANAKSQSTNLLDKSKYFAAHLQLGAQMRKQSITLANASTIVAIPNSPNTVRSISAVDILIIDEAAYVGNALFYAIVPFLATTDGHLWLLSTANNQSGFFYDIITSNGRASHDKVFEPISLRESGHAASRSDASTNSTLGRVGHADPGGYIFAVFIATAPDCPRIPASFLADERALKPSAQFAQEYLCQFMPTRGQIFDATILKTTPSTTHGPLASTLIFGLDIGFHQNHTALAVLHLSWSYAGKDPASRADKYQPHLSLVQLERFPLATAHSEAWATIERTIQFHTSKLTAQSPSNALPPTRVLVFDYAGAGQVYYEHFRRNCKQVTIQPVTITGGQTPDTKADYVTIPRQDLLNTLKVLIETQLLQIPAGLNYLKEFIEECKGLNITNSQKTPDDLAIAVSLAAYRARVQMSKPPTGLPKGPLL